MRARSGRAPARSPWHLLVRRRSRAALPVNSDIEVARTVAGVPVMIQIRPGHLGLAAVGGAVGTAARYGVTTVAPTWQTLSVGTVLVNLLGPFSLGVLLQLLTAGAESRRRRALRLVVGVGFLGAFTSYAQLAVDAVMVTEHGHAVLALAYVLATIAAGAVVAWLGIVAATRWSGRERP
jgi:fluoride exporter